MIIGGTSLAVYPAAGLIRYYQGEQLVMINRSPTPADSEATLLINSSIGEVLKTYQKNRIEIQYFQIKFCIGNMIAVILFLRGTPRKGGNNHVELL